MYVWSVDHDIETYQWGMMQFASECKHIDDVLKYNTVSQLIEVELHHHIGFWLS